MLAALPICLHGLSVEMRPMRPQLTLHRLRLPLHRTGRTSSLFPGGGCAAGLHHSQDLNLTSSTHPEEDSNLHCLVQSQVSCQLDDRGKEGSTLSRG